MSRIGDPGCQPPATTPPCSTSSMPRVRVTVTGTVPRIFKLFGSSPTSFSRVETFPLRHPRHNPDSGLQADVGITLPRT